MTKFISTSEKVEISDYPYGFRLRTTLFDSIEFDAKKGYRHVTQTINPKNNQLNKPKKSTYSPLMVRYYDEKNHIKTISFSFNGDKEMNQGVKFLHDHFDLFTEEEISYLYTYCLALSKISMKASVIYSGAKFEDLKPLYDALVKALVEGINNPTENHFGVALDIEAIEKCKDPNFQPFRTTRAVNIMDL